MIESGSAHQVHHYALLFGMGADAVCPYMCYYALFKARDQGKLGMNYSNTELTQSVKNAFDYGVRKVMAKIGISTLQSYHGAQIFEALGVHQEIMDRAFTGTPSRIRCMYIHTYIHTKYMSCASGCVSDHDRVSAASPSTPSLATSSSTTTWPSPKTPSRRATSPSMGSSPASPRRESGAPLTQRALTSFRCQTWATSTTATAASCTTTHPSRWRCCRRPRARTRARRTAPTRRSRTSWSKASLCAGS